MKIIVARRMAVFLVAGLALGAGVPAASALECPRLQSLDGSTTLPDLTAQLKTKDVLSQIPGILGYLHEQFPHAGKLPLDNYLIASYCAVVKADATLSEVERQAKIRDFADKVVSKSF
ncbi:hypothetical protein K9U39_10545 [Rhodoblastus acidophilus]|uniref:Uncharacterized protein n=1 Tax=Candidatus Rhodoblastus alkanivorans TaxID=2954117 RepID=A0ABS9Z9E1_9HYPH|nr:hypothetical protein [Candidatus Rhodoblastus alkanivorans]MCI4679322.1 hypothetical protein [Candidatus Rhodoblastus alkanivorans]MCI4684051.1 hypothetical protein [Candidatus Rhodoblastus alkanivorans]MDI4641371.1 hypothetical protein [Rhodoblastus acidophilus]